MNMRVKLDPWGIMPEREHDTDAGMDIKAPSDVWVNAGSSVTIDTGVHIELPHGTVGLLKSKSGLNVKHGIVSDGVIDEGYTGSIAVKLYNHGKTAFQFKRGDKITQLLVMPVLYATPVQADNIQGGERGNNGFGSTGR